MKMKSTQTQTPRIEIVYVCVRRASNSLSALVFHRLFPPTRTPEFPQLGIFWILFFKPPPRETPRIGQDFPHSTSPQFNKVIYFIFYVLTILTCRNLPSNDIVIANENFVIVFTDYNIVRKWRDIGRQSTFISCVSIAWKWLQFHTLDVGGSVFLFLLKS